MSDHTSHRRFDGTLVTAPFGGENVERTAREEYRTLLDEYDSEDVLVVTGAPTSTDTFRESLGSELPGAATPYVTSLVVHATDVLNQSDDRVILSDTLRRELLYRFLADYEWETEYLRRASEQPSFIEDVDAVMGTISWQTVTPEETPELCDIAAALDAFHDWLAENGHMERGQLISEALDVLSGDARDGVVDFEAVLVVEFEEFFPLDRAYLDALVGDCELVCIAEENASVRRTWVETGPVTDYVSFSESRRGVSESPSTRPAATAAYFAEETTSVDPGTGSVSVLATDSSDEHLAEVANEIEALVVHSDWSYDDIAVATKRSGSTVTDIIEAFEGTGIPTESTTVTGFGDDPAIRELLAAVRQLGADGEDEVPDHGPELDTQRLDRVHEMDSLGDAVRWWATDTGLKERIAERATPLDARAQFGNVRRAFRMAEFLEDTEFVDATWASFEEMLERAHKYAPQQNQTSATNLDGGVRVDHLQAIKNESFRAVFLVNLVDSEYPGDPFLTRLFPNERVESMPDYPGVTELTGTDVDVTFPTTSTASSRPFARYHTEHARRRLAIGAGAADEHLYCCLYEYEDTALEERAQASRFLTDAYDRLPWVTETDDPLITSEQAAEDFLLSRVDDALAAVRRASSQNIMVSLDEVEAELGEIQNLLDKSGARGEELREALRARVEFANGEVRR
ncbi:PD-(D/E)XK nuclease family protein [Haloferax larsenii]|uniref:Superfamily I DNA or RNA helicase n=1 Tax=Haloferax larsenii TaxID=302484 RepID=A0A1H7TTB2_HALLR|nr:DNA helicase UvrD [Haloferax larsenii]SEL87157.1 Superfamily I DNA or RNA helicase [Haloferax larsenii]